MKQINIPLRNIMGWLSIIIAISLVYISIESSLPTDDFKHLSYWDNWVRTMKVTIPFIGVALLIIGVLVLFIFWLAWCFEPQWVRENRIDNRRQRRTQAQTQELNDDDNTL